MSEKPARTDRTLLVIVGAVVIIVIVALAVVFSRGAPQQLDGATPEGTVQRYATALLEGDEATAALYLSPAALASCERTDRSSTGRVSVSLVSTTVRDDTADVTVSITTSYEGGPFGSSDYETEGVVDLVKTDGAWRIDSAPWELTVCPNPKVDK
ncbi:hypothetical protein GY21_12210 [Cryobacterium roopkundense]|uniref:Lipoprotein LpqB N-terminal domain-containing protein n=1 Tax=Cryobacterium roopkundense TaxID=1001240 RepID=A0A099J4A8_9MICO|nr:hypothetical protein [Cryobacterium roopkundense]KGJ72920.1 hypothetical protein GY21_12210 [Cryobacterium roopkundense]MBB5642079.1 hypothetical protein [Cryobacterium roopkundense]